MLVRFHTNIPDRETDQGSRRVEVAYPVELVHHFEYIARGETNVYIHGQDEPVKAFMGLGTLEKHYMSAREQLMNGGPKPLPIPDSIAPKLKFHKFVSDRGGKCLKCRRVEEHPIHHS